MQVSNPASYFVTGSDEKSFTFVPGSKPFQVQVRGSHNYIPANMLIMADSEDHVRKILRELVDFRIMCHNEYVEHKNALAKKFKDYHDTIDSRKIKMIELANQIGQWLTGNTDNLPDGFAIHIDEAPMGQIFKTSWASNDNVLA